ncbi:MAG: hypothetical protein OXH76_07260 [Boseongicola sp.]|nr:hypothetical protein [Boseongicola sp.]
MTKTSLERIHELECNVEAIKYLLTLAYALSDISSKKLGDHLDEINSRENPFPPLQGDGKENVVEMDIQGAVNMIGREIHRHLESLDRF